MAVNNPLGLALEANPGEWDIELKLFDILATYLPQDSVLSSQDAAEQINSLFPNNRPGDDEKESPGSFLSEFWDLMFRIGYQLDYQDVPMQRFISLIKALRQLPSEITLENGSRVWQDLPDLPIYLTERWHSKLPRHSDSSLPVVLIRRLYRGCDFQDRCSHCLCLGLEPLEYMPGAEKLHRWKNLNGLIAHLTNEEIYGGLYRALTSISMSLESDDKKTIKTIVASLVPTAAIWFVLCGPKIYNACQEEKCKDSDVRGKLWRGTPGYSKERWDFWRSRFTELSTHPEAEVETKDACQVATAAIDAVAG